MGSPEKRKLASLALSFKLGRVNGNVIFPASILWPRNEAFGEIKIGIRCKLGFCAFNQCILANAGRPNDQEQRAAHGVRRRLGMFLNKGIGIQIPKILQRFS